MNYSITEIENVLEVTGGRIVNEDAIVSQLLVLCGAILGVKASYDVKFSKMAAEIRNVERKTGIEPEDIKE